MSSKKAIKNKIKSWLNQLPYIKTLHKLNSNSKFPNGHYYSTVVSLEEIKRRQDEIWKPWVSQNIEGIDLNIANQLKLLKNLSLYYSEIPFTYEKQKNLRYNFNNSYYGYADGISLYAMMRHLKPKNIIEVGSGYSSALMLDVNNLYFDNKINLTFIEPFPEVRLNGLLKENDRENTKIIEKNVQLVPLEIFKNLVPGDILFIDSSHAVKTGSDVNYILFEILPALSKGVFIHFHDIHFPFEYPKQWILDGFGWNETYFLKAFLMYNTAFDIVLFSNYLLKYHKKAYAKIPLFFKGGGSDLWIVKN